MAIILTERDEVILKALCQHVRLISIPQATSTWWSESLSSEDNARRRFEKLREYGYVIRCRVLAAPLPTMIAPIVRWNPGDAHPDTGHIAWKLQCRWREGPSAIHVYIASFRAAKILGGKARGRLKQEFQATHDLGVTQMYLDLLKDKPDDAKRWIGEDVLAPYRRRQKLPDAVLAEHPNATPDLVLEFGGAYDKRRVQSFHRDCADRALPYEIW